MRATSWLAMMVRCTLCACQLPSTSSQSSNPAHGNSDADDTESTRPALSCAPQEPEWSDVVALHASTDESVHELITCGGLQVRIAGDIVMMLIASNEDLFKKDERALLTDLMLNPFSQTADGHWTMELEDAPGSSFTLAFYDPDSGERIEDNVFDLDSYLSGVHIQSDVGFTEIVANPDKKHAFVFRWDSVGPLGHLLNDGEPLPDGFTLQLSLSDFFSRHASDFGPFESVFQVELDSVVDYVDQRSDADVEYLVSTRRDAMKRIATSESLAFVVDHLSSQSASLTLDGDTGDLTFVHLGELAGRIDYTFGGKLAGKSVKLRVRSDFGEGAAYPESEWSCR
jgi:hypothetical protein